MTPQGVWPWRVWPLGCGLRAGPGMGCGLRVQGWGGCGLALEGVAWLGPVLQTILSLSPQVIEYNSARDLETFSKFLDNGGELPAEEPTEEESLAPSLVSASAQGARPLDKSSGSTTMGLSGQGWAQGTASSCASVTPSRRHQPIPPRSPRKSCSRPHIRVGSRHLRGLGDCGP